MLKINTIINKQINTICLIVIRFRDKAPTTEHYRLLNYNKLNYAL